jgi:FKBP-type peptidyl-prolyl cis-trans isomerase FklB
MRKLTLLSIYVLGIGIALQVPAASAQTGASGTTAKPPATQAATSGTAAVKPPAAKPAAGQVTLKDQKAKTSYAIGMNLGHVVKSQPVELDQAAFIQGIKDVLAGGKTLMSEDEMAAALTVLQTEMNAKAADEAKKAGETNKVEGAAYLAANKTKPGVVTLPSGLQYKIITEGTGPKPTAADTVVCNYRGTLISGKEFDSSYKRGQPTPFAVGRVIRGWTEALQLMPTGSKWQLFIPADLAYSDHPPPGSGIGPNATLIFEVELISIQGK